MFDDVITLIWEHLEAINIHGRVQRLPYVVIPQSFNSDKTLTFILGKKICVIHISECALCFESNVITTEIDLRSPDSNILKFVDSCVEIVKRAL